MKPGDVGIFVLDGEGYLKAYDEREPDAGDAEDYLDSDGVLHRQVVLQRIADAVLQRPGRSRGGRKMVITVFMILSSIL